MHIILASYQGDYASTWGRKVRNTIQENPDRLRVRISDDSAAAHLWETTAGGGMSSSGTSGAITGKPAHVLVIDDPLKSREEAESATYRNKNWEWWQGTARTRLNPLPWAPYSVVIVMATRWHYDDLSGRLLARKVDQPEDAPYAIPWVEYKLPALAEEHDPLGRKVGEALWPEKYPLELLRAIQVDTSPYDWMSEYQQSPILKEGNLFKRDYFRPIEVTA